MSRKKTAGVVSLGCSKNLVDTEFLMGNLASDGWSFAPGEEGAGLLIVNTCAFLEASVEESREAIEDAVAWKAGERGRKIVVAGCLVSRFGTSLRTLYPDVDLFLSPGRIPRASDLLAGRDASKDPNRGRERSFLPPRYAERLLTTGYWAYLKVSDGCDNRCSYCLIPSIRGRHRSRPLRSILVEAAGLVEAGAREICLVGQDITRWGEDRGERRLPDLVESLAALPGDFRIRLLYLHPVRVEAPLRLLLAEHPKVFPYLDIPIQHASTKVLRGMNRPYGRRDLGRAYDLLRREIPGVALRTTVMVGFPGEGKREFGELLGFLRDHPFENLGAFVFSPQEGTPASRKRMVTSPEETEERYHQVMSRQKGLSARLWKQRRGRTVEAIVLAPSDGSGRRWQGRTAWQAPEVDGGIEIHGEAAPGDLVSVRIIGSGAYDLKGEITDVPSP